MSDVPARPPHRPGPAPRLRALLLAVQVLGDVDLEIADRWLLLPGGHRIAWRHVRAEARGLSAGSERDRRRLAAWLESVQQLAAMPADLRVEHLRPVGLPVGHVLHPGGQWARETVLGGALDLGIGVLGLRPARPDVVEVVTPTAWAALRVDPTPHWPRCGAVLEEMGLLAGRRWALSSDGQLRPMGDCDVLTLLGAVSLRRRLAGTDGGMRAVLAPMRRRGWTRLSRLDPAFGPAAAMATDPVDRGFLRPLLVTADEVVLAGDGGRVDISIVDPVTEPWQVARTAR